MRKRAAQWQQGAESGHRGGGHGIAASIVGVIATATSPIRSPIAELCGERDGPNNKSQRWATTAA